MSEGDETVIEKKMQSELAPSFSELFSAPCRHFFSAPSSF